jgi:hypothetical protein
MESTGFEYKFTIVTLLIVLAIIPVTVIYLGNRQVIEQQAATILGPSPTSTPTPSLFE